MTYEKVHQPLDSMGKLVLPMADALRDDDRVFMLTEYDLPDERISGMYRWQLIRVERGDRLYDFPRKLGPSSDFAAGPLIWFCDGEKDTADKMIALAEEWRGRNQTNQVLLERTEGRPLVDTFIEREEQKMEFIKRNTRTLRAGFGLPTV